MLPADRCSFHIVGDREQTRIVPDYLSAADHPWLAELVDRVVAHAGSRRADLDRALKEPLSTEAPPKRVRMAAHVLRARVKGRRPDVAVPPKEARRALFAHAGTTAAPRDTVLAEVAASLEVSVDALEEALFADLPSERRVVPLDPLPALTELTLQTNLGLVQGLLKRASRVTITLRGNARDVVRYARLRGLICVATRHPDGVQLELSGPFALFRRTTLYGRAQGALVPRLPWCAHFRVEASCHVGDRQLPLHLCPHDPVFPAAPPRRFDSKLEARFARDLTKAHPDWELVREPEALVAGDRLIFPDFGLRHRDRPERRYLVELVGFWTPSYLRRKLEGLAAANVDNLVLCVDRTLDCSDAELPPDLPVVWFRRRVDPDEVVAAIEHLPRETAPR